MSEVIDLGGQHALVTGGGTGLGLATAKALDRAGAEVTIVGRRADVLERALEGFGPRAKMLAGDIAAAQRHFDVAADDPKCRTNAAASAGVCGVRTDDAENPCIYGLQVQPTMRLVQLGWMGEKTFGADNR